MKIAVLIGAEAYQAHHVADIAFELAGRDGVEVEILALLPEALAEVRRLERSPADSAIARRLLTIPPHLRLLQRARLFGSLKVAVLRARENLSLLSGYDVIVTPTDHTRFIRPFLNPCPSMIYVNHGIGGREASYSEKYLGFDFVLVAGRNDEQRLLEKRRVRPGRYGVIGYPKFEAADRLRKGQEPLFPNDRPTVLFNPHSKRALRSWERFARPLIDHVAGTGEFNLVVAPHAKMFGRRPRFVWRRWERLAVPGRVIVDLGSPRALDMTYSAAADIYAGDVSSQIYEFLSEPKPCVFLNAHSLDWKESPNFPTWDLGDVVDTPAAAIEAIRTAQERHVHYRELQARRMAEVVDKTPGAARRGADAVLEYLNRPAQSPVMFLLSDLGTGGTARATMMIVNGLVERGYDVSLVVARGSGALTSELDRRVKLIELKAAAARGAGMLSALKGLVATIKAERPVRLVSAGNHMHVMATLAYVRAAVPGCSLILKMTNPVERQRSGRFGNLLRRGWYRWAFGKADRVLLIADSTRGEMARTYSAAAAKLRVVDNPYITDAMLDAGAEPAAFEPGRLLAIGRLVAQKNYPLMLRALARSRELEWTLDILGDGPLLDGLQSMARELGIADRVNFRGFVPNTVDYLRSAHALLLSSAWEGQGAVLLEALACGCPVVATRSTAAVGDVLGEGRYGTLVPPGDEEALAQAIATELRQRSKVSSDARKWVERYRIDAGIRSHVEALGLTETRAC
ncbi:MAG: glycosyltransferase [Sphingomicrobium sp.]